MEVVREGVIQLLLIAFYHVACLLKLSISV